MPLAILILLVALPIVTPIMWLYERVFARDHN